jgi:hypothetical protein
MLVRIKRAATMAAAGLAGALVFGMAQAVTPFQTDVATAINNGLAYLDTSGAYAIPACKTGCTNNAGYAVGLTTLALLEKRASGNPNDPPQGYNGASSADQTRLRQSVAAILSNIYSYYLFNGYPTYFYAYFDGSALSALSEYLLSGGPDTCGPAPNPHSCADYPSTPAELQGFQMSVLQDIDAMVDATVANQRTPANGYTVVAGYPAFETGYWCYSNGACTDSSTTQYAALGLSAAESVYNNPNFGDPGNRLPAMQNALTLAANIYATDFAQGSEDTNCDPGYKTTPNGGVNGTPGDANAYGHGYHSPAENYAPSLQQTASGMFVQLLGGSNVNSPMVQGYERWIYDHYRWSDIGAYNGAGQLYNSWAESYFYYLWSSFKGIEFMTQQGVSPSSGNLGPQSYGTLAPTAGPVCPDRQVHRDPSSLPQVPLFGAGSGGYYSAETQSQYFDYAYTILSYQCASGGFFCSAAASAGGYQNPDQSGGWDTYDTQAYALLVLQRATGVVLPTATLTASASSVPVGTGVTLTWGSENANSCAASGGAAGDGWTGSSLATSGNLPVKETAAGTYTYTIICSAGTQSAQAQVQVTFTAANYCDVAGATGMTPDGEVSMYDITAIRGMLGELTQPNGPAPDNADPMGAGKITAQDVRACMLRCTKASCAN